MDIVVVCDGIDDGIILYLDFLGSTSSGSDFGRSCGCRMGGFACFGYLL